MATDAITIYNLALSACGTRASVASTADTSKEARLCNQWYDHVRRLVLGAAPWKEATAMRRLSVLAERDASLAWVSGDPKPGWVYAYGAPNDMLRPRFLGTFASFDYGVFNGVRAISANDADALLTYTADLTNASLWEQDLVDAVAFTLAANICNSLTGSGNKSLTLMQVAQEKVLIARAADANSEGNQLLDTTPPWIAARGYAEGPTSSRYIYPNAELMAGGLALAK